VLNQARSWRATLREVETDRFTPLEHDIDSALKDLVA